MVFSRFTHTLEKDGVVALYNSLRIRPLYLMKNTFDSAVSFVDSGAELETCVSADLKAVLKQMAEDKIIVPGNAYDDAIIARLRTGIGESAIQIAYFILTENCNFRRKYCFIMRKMPPNYRSLAMNKENADKSVETYTRLLAGSNNEDNMIILYGGEPLLNFDVVQHIVDTVETYKAKKLLTENLKIAIVTNGTLITENIARYLHTHQIGLSISIDGYADVTDSNRRYTYTNGEPIYSAIRKGIKIAQDAGCDVSLSVTMSNEALKHFDDTMDLIINDIQAKDLGFNILMEDESDDPVYAEAAAEFIIKAFQRFRALGIYEDRIMRRVKSFTDKELHLFDCTAASGNKIVVAPDGAIGICHGYLGSRKYFCGNVADNAFDPKQEKVFQEWSKRTPVNMKECESCIALGICGGGCPHNADKKHGSIWALDDRFCVHAKKTLHWLIWDLYEKTQNRK